MKRTSLSLTLVSYGLTALVACFAMNHASAQVTSWDNSPYNYNNSPLNYNNSSLNYNNSPLNYQNSPLNYNSNNGVYDNSGNRIGYEVKAPTGVTNVFDNQGNRIGYSPSKK
jgi:hypothetical protein